MGIRFWICMLMPLGVPRPIKRGGVVWSLRRVRLAIINWIFFDENDIYSDRRATVTIRIIPSEGGDFTIEVEANLQVDAFANGGEEGWLTLKSVSEPTKALTKRVYTFHAQPNEYTYSRSGYIQFMSIGEKLYMDDVVIQVMQEQKDSIRLSEKTGIGSGLVYNMLGCTYICWFMVRGVICSSRNA